MDRLSFKIFRLISFRATFVCVRCMPWLFINEKVINRFVRFFLDEEALKTCLHIQFSQQTHSTWSIAWDLFCRSLSLAGPLSPLPDSLSISAWISLSLWLSISPPNWKRLDESFRNSCQCMGHAYFPSFMSHMKCRIFNLVVLGNDRHRMWNESENH